MLEITIVKRLSDVQNGQQGVQKERYVSKSAIKKTIQHHTYLLKGLCNGVQGVGGEAQNWP